MAVSSLLVVLAVLFPRVATHTCGEHVLTAATTTISWLLASAPLIAAAYRASSSTGNPGRFHMRDSVLLYDGECGFCSATVQLILRYERRHTLRFAPLHSAFGAAVLARHPEFHSQDSVVWFEPSGSGAPELVLTRSDAVLRISDYMGGLWRLAVAAHVVPRSWRDACYDFVARRRHRIPGLSSSCLRPDVANKDRFIP